MSVIRKEKITGPSAWKGKDLRDDDSWIYHWSEKSIAVMERALEQVKSKGLTVPDFTKEDFPIHEMAEEIAYVKEELEDGRGVI